MATPSISVRYFLAKKKSTAAFAIKSRHHVPRIGEEVRFSGKVFKIEHIVWVEDGAYPCVNILITPLKEKA